MKKINDKCIISFCIPCYKYDTDKLIRCLDSILNCGMNLSNYEVIVVDDGDTEEIKKSLVNTLTKYKDKTGMNLGLIIHSSNMGLYEVRKTAVHDAAGEYICHIDYDDYLEPGCFKDIKHFYSRNGTKWDIIQYRYNTITSKKTVPIPEKHILSPNKYKSEKSLLNLYTTEGKIPQYIWGKLISRNLYERVRTKLPDVYVNFAEDFLALTFLTAYAKTYMYRDILMYNYMRTEDSMTSHENKMGISKWRNLLTVGNVIAITDPKYFTDEKVKKFITNKHYRYITELFSILTLDDVFIDEETKKQAVNEFIGVFGEGVFNQLNESFKAAKKKARK